MTHTLTAYSAGDEGDRRLAHRTDGAPLPFVQRRNDFGRYATHTGRLHTPTTNGRLADRVARRTVRHVGRTLPTVTHQTAYSAGDALLGRTARVTDGARIEGSRCRAHQTAYSAGDAWLGRTVGWTDGGPE